MRRRTARACSQDTVDELRHEVRLLRKVVRQLTLQQGLYQSTDPEAKRVIRLLTQLEMAHPLEPIPPEPIPPDLVTTVTLDDESLTSGVGHPPSGS
jgi:hypothetical protein